MQEAAGGYSIMVLSKADIMTADVNAGDTGERGKWVLGRSAFALFSGEQVTQTSTQHLLVSPVLVPSFLFPAFFYYDPISAPHNLTQVLKKKKYARKCGEATTQAIKEESRAKMNQKA